MPDWIAAVLKWIKVGPSVWLALLCLSGIALFAPSSFLLNLHINDLVRTYTDYFGLCFVVSLCFLLSSLFFYIFEIIKSKWERRKGDAKLIQHLHELTPDEKAYIATYVLKSCTTNYYQANDGVAGGLRRKGILFLSAQIGSMHRGFAHNISTWAKRHLVDNIDLLDGASDEPRRPPGPF